MELDTCANTMVLGKNCLLIQAIGKVLGWNASAGSTKCPTVSGLVVYNHLHTGVTYMLKWRQAIYLDTMDNHLICPMQCRMQGVTIHDMPKIFVKNPTHVLLWSRTQ